MDRRHVMVGVLVLAAAGTAAGQTVIYAVRANGDLLRLDLGSGAGFLVGSSGVPCEAAAAYWYQDRFSSAEGVAVAGGTGTWADRLSSVNRWTGAGQWWATLSGRPAGYTVHGLAPYNRYSVSGYVLLKAEQPGPTDLLASLEVPTAALTVLGPTGRTDLADIALVASTGTLYALGTAGGGALYTLNTATGQATLVGGGGYGADDRALGVLPDGTLLACGSSLRRVDPQTGEATLIGPTGFTEIRGLAPMTPCYANCDTGGPPPMLNVNDFVCFQQKFAAGLPEANCDLSTMPPVLNVNDFVCFLNAWVTAAGCG